MMFRSSTISIQYVRCECGKAFPSESALQAHVMRDHVKKPEKKYYQCGNCEKFILSVDGSLNHQCVHTASCDPPPSGSREPDDSRKPDDPPPSGSGEPDDSRKPDDHCDKPKKKKKPKTKNILCEMCGMYNWTMTTLFYHQRVHTGERPHQCSFCPRSFTSSSLLKMHKPIHTGLKPYACPHCDKAFVNKTGLKRHDRVHTGIKPYKCPTCGKCFTQSNSRKVHMDTVHLKMPAPYKSKARRMKALLKKGLTAAQAEVEILKPMPKRRDSDKGEDEGKVVITADVVGAQGEVGMPTEVKAEAEVFEVEWGVASEVTVDVEASKGEVGMPTEVKAEAEVFEVEWGVASEVTVDAEASKGDGAYLYYDPNMFDEDDIMLQEVEIGQSESTTDEVEGQVNVVVLYQEDNGRVMYVVGDQGEML